MSRLAERFSAGDMEVFAALDILLPQKLPVSPELHAQHSVDEVEVLCNTYGQPQVRGDGSLAPAMIDATSFRMEWKLYKKMMVQLKASIASGRKSEESVMVELLTSTAVGTNVLKLLQIRRVLVFHTAACERGFSRMGLIKSALRNRLYIETLDALLMLGLVGPRFMGSESSKRLIEKAIRAWESTMLRNPNQARFGNSNARKVGKARTFLPTSASTDQSDLACFDLDVNADKDEEQSANVLWDNGTAPECSNESADIGHFRVPVGFKVCECPAKVDKKLARSKVAYKFISGWQTGTFKSFYTGAKPEFKGKSRITLNRSEAYYVDLQLNNYGITNDWVIVKKVK